MTTSFIDNRDENTLLNGMLLVSSGGREISIATAFFSLDALLLLADTLAGYEKVRILFGDDANKTQRQRLLQLLRQTSHEDLLSQCEDLPNLTPSRVINRPFQLADALRTGNVHAR